MTVYWWCDVWRESDVKDANQFYPAKPGETSNETERS